jgi:hypothetical protein
MINTKEILGIIRDYFEKLYPNKLENLEEMHKFLDTNDQPKLNPEDISHLNRSITHNKIEAAIKSPPKATCPGPDRFSTEFYQTFKEEPIPKLLELRHEIEREQHCLTHFMKIIFTQTKTIQGHILKGDIGQHP